MSASKAICLIGWGAIARRVAALLQQRQSPVRIAAIAVRDAGKPRDDLPDGARLIEMPQQLADVEAGLVVEAAGRDSVIAFGEAAFSHGMDYAVSSTSAFTDEAVLAHLLQLAEQKGRQLIIPPGALGGIDALAAAALLGLERVEHRIVKPPAAWRGTPAETLLDLDHLSEETVFFRGTARDAAAKFPQNANVAIITSLAGIGLDQTELSLVADPFSSLNRHEIHASGDFGVMDIRLQNRPLANNPKSSEMTALNIVRMIENRCNSLVI